MPKWKALLIDIVIASLLIGIMYLCWENAIRIFGVFEIIFAIYGFCQFIYILYTWLLTPSTELKPMRVKEPAFKMPKVPDSWINPFKSKEETE